MRVIAGEAKGRTLVVPKGGGTRAATDRIRETLFAILEPGLGGAAVLDLFAGAGTLGIEALSRGAKHTTFVERGSDAVRALRRNVEITGFVDRSTIAPVNVLSFLQAGPRGPFDVVFSDPPFADVDVATATLAHPSLAAALSPSGLVVARAFRKHAPSVPATARVVRQKEIGEETLFFLRYADRAAGG
jgi:16S rRNA (guanine966-N2)-methyltransferase